MSLKRVATWKSSGETYAILLEIDGKQIAVSPATIEGLTETQINTALQNIATIGGVELPPIFIHINDDGTVAIATGAEPEVWPEDEVYPEGPP
jgi:hypothetical protein